MAGEVLTQDEMDRIYASPKTSAEAINLIYGSHDGMTIGEVRDKVRELLKKLDD